MLEKIVMNSLPRYQVEQDSSFVEINNNKSEESSNELTVMIPKSDWKLYEDKKKILMKKLV